MSSSSLSSAESSLFDTDFDIEELTTKMQGFNFTTTSESNTTEKTISPFSSFLHPKKVILAKLQDEVPVEEYLQVIRQRVLAEYWAFFVNALDSPKENLTVITMRKVPRKGFGGVGAMEELLDSQGGTEEFTVTEPGRAAVASTSEDEGAYSYNLIIREGKLGILSYNRDRNTYTLFRGMQLNFLSGLDARKCYTFGYIGNRVKDLSAINKLSAMEVKPSLIQSASKPSGRRVVAYPLSGASKNMLPINKYQKQAVDNFKFDLEFIQGPPGTGKSTTIYHIIYKYVREEAQCALVSCVSNKAIDAIAEKFAQCNLVFIVVGREDRIGSTAKHWTLQAQIESHKTVKPWIQAVENLKQNSKKLEDVMESETRKERVAVEVFQQMSSSGNCHVKDCAEKSRDDLSSSQLLATSSLMEKSKKSFFNILWKHIQDFIITAQSRAQSAGDIVSAELKKKCTAVLATIDSCGSAVAELDKDILKPEDCIAHRLNLVVLDEAGTIPEAKVCVIVANLPKVTRIISIGDQKQLEPFSDIQKKKDEQTDGIFHRSLRVFQSRGGVPILRIQFRMHPKICKLVSKLAYEDKLITDEGVANKRVAVMGENAIKWQTYNAQSAIAAMTKAQKSGRASMKNSSNSSKKIISCESKRGKSWQNDTEVKIVCDVVENLRRKYQANKKSLLVITFYKGQLFALRESLAKRGILGRDKFGKPQDPEDVSIRVVTVDSAQGSEADLVVLSCVRSNANRDIGFLTNQNRAVVALSRARELLYIVGDKHTVADRSGPWRNAFRAAKLV